VHVEGHHRIHQALLRILRDAVEHGDALLGLADVVELRLAHADELLPLGSRLIQRLEDLANLALLDAALEQPFERAQRVLMLRRRADHLAVRADRTLEVVQPHLVDLTQAVLELEDLVRALTDLGLARQDLRQIVPALGLREQAIERAHGALVLGIDVEHAAVARHGVVQVLELHLVDLRHTQA
jgi:hypothetical protein